MEGGEIPGVRRIDHLFDPAEGLASRPGLTPARTGG